MKVRPLLFVLSLIAPAVSPHAAASGAQTLEILMEGYAGHFREHCLPLQRGRTVALMIVSPHAVRWNVHYHDQAGTHFLLDEIVQQSASRNVAIPSDGEYCFEVKNPESRPSSFELRLDYRVSGGPPDD